MNSYNKGEWSEIYVFLKCLSDGKFYVKDSKLEKILSTYNILEIYKYDFLNKIEKCFRPEECEKNECSTISSQLLTKIKTSQTTTFTIPFLENYAKIKNFSLKKGKSNSKSDLDAKSLDSYNNETSRLEYSIKSKLGNPATLLNASTHTNFLYKINNIEFEDVEKINKINTKQKLKDKMNSIFENSLKVEFLEVTSNQFKSNLSLIDGDLEKILGYILLYSYIYSQKNLIKLIELIKEENPLKYDNKSFYDSKINRFLIEIAASMVPGTKVDELSGENNIFGGLLLVEESGDISLIDNIYYKKELKNYLSNNLKLDSPSSSRFDMLNLKYDTKKKEATFTLNLQIRFIK
ncbi:MAG: HpaII family restriction endonuclease [Cetobacterium sp.]